MKLCSQKEKNIRIGLLHWNFNLSELHQAQIFTLARDMLNRILYLTVTPESVKLQNNFQVQLLEKLSPLGLVTVHKQEQLYHFTLSVTSSFNVFNIFF